MMILSASFSSWLAAAMSVSLIRVGVVAFASGSVVSGCRRIHALRCEVRPVGDEHVGYIKLDPSELLHGVQETPATRSERRQWRNVYVGLRHGQSEANVEGIISSDPTVGIASHGLTETGRQQAQQAAADLFSLYQSHGLGDGDFLSLLQRTVFCSSDFKRALQTADIVREHMLALCATDADLAASPVVIPPVEIVPYLRERYFGKLDALPLIYYNRVWPIDTLDAANNRDGVASVNQVIGSIEKFFSFAESRFENKIVVAVSHADTLQIMQTYYLTSKRNDVDPRLFHQYRFRNGEARPLDNLPPPTPLTYS